MGNGSEMDLKGLRQNWLVRKQKKTNLKFNFLKPLFRI